MAERVRMFKRLPEIWKRLDRDDTREDGKGVLERSLGVLDTSFDLAQENAAAIKDLRSVDHVPDRFLKHQAPLVGRQWRGDMVHSWNRRRQKHAIPRHSYKGTLARVGDAVADNGGGDWSVIDQASKLFVLGKQANLGSGACRFVAPDYYHDGAFILCVTDAVDLAGLRADLAETLAGGERWYLRITESDVAITESVITERDAGVEINTNTREGTLGYGRLGIDLWLGGESAQPEAEHVREGDTASSNAYLTTDSPLSIMTPGLTTVMGTPENPLPEEIAAIQPEEDVLRT